jgi:prepilin-type processing-associated H-X9-DG protein
VAAKSIIVDRLKPGKIAAGPAYVLGTTFLHGDEHELEERSRETVAEIFGSAHADIMNFLFCDGSVRTIAVEIDDHTYMTMSTTQDQLPSEGVVHFSPLPPPPHPSVPPPPPPPTGGPPPAPPKPPGHGH